MNKFRQHTIADENQYNEITYTAGLVSEMVSCFVNCAMLGMGDFYNKHSKHVTHALLIHETDSHSVNYMNTDSPTRNANAQFYVGILQ